MNKKGKFKKISSYFIAICAAVFLLFVFSIGFVNAQKVPFGVKLVGIDVGGMSFGEVKNKIDPIAKDFLKQKVSMIIGDKKYETTLENLGANIDLESSVREAMQSGRGKDFLNNFLMQLKFIVKGNDLYFDVEFDDGKFEDYLKNFRIYEFQRQNAVIYLDDSGVILKIQDSKDGKIVDRDKLKNDLKKYTKGYKGVKETAVSEITVSFETDYSEITNDMAQNHLAEAQRFFDQSSGINLIYGGNGKDSWLVDKKTVGSWIGFEFDEDKNLKVIFDKTKIAEYLTQISPNINKNPVDAVLRYKEGRVEAFKLSQDGSFVDSLNSAVKIALALQNKEKEAVLEMNKVKAKIDISEIENLGLTSLLATGVSDFAGSPKNRVHNIKIGAAKFNGILLKSQEELSFSSILGEVDEKEGYLPELVIKKGMTVPEYGGGICQVSTTAFRAAMIAGLEIKERYPHSFPVKYYSPQGFDAAIYPPSPDLKFLNDTPNNLLIQTKIVGTKIYFEFYGTDDGRKVVLTGPEEYDKKPDGSMKAKLTREIFDKDGELIRKTIFRSSYKSPDLYPVKKNPLE